MNLFWDAESSTPFADHEKTVQAWDIQKFAAIVRLADWAGNTTKVHVATEVGAGVRPVLPCILRSRHLQSYAVLQSDCVLECAQAACSNSSSIMPPKVG